MTTRNFNPLVLISHGEIPIQTIPNVFDQHSFRCPQNITIHFFETVGKKFIKNDAGLLCNLISTANQRNNLAELLDYLDDKKFKTPFATKYYYSKKYIHNDIVPNILFKLEDKKTQIGLFNLRSHTHGSHFVEFDNLAKPGQDGPQWDINFDADTQGNILGPKNVIQSPIPGGKPLFKYAKIEQDLSNIIKKLSLHAPPGKNINLLIISCRNFVSPKLDSVIASSNYISLVEPNIHRNYNKLLTDYENIIKECEVALKKNVRHDLAKEVMTSKKDVSSNLNELVRRLKKLVKITFEGYEDFKDIVIKIALEDHLHKKEIAGLSDEMNAYLPDIPGNALTRAHSRLNQLKQHAGGKNNTYSKIKCPITGKQISINSKRGRSIIKNYSKYYKSQ